jgi:hypothetical protein
MVMTTTIEDSNIGLRALRRIGLSFNRAMSASLTRANRSAWRAKTMAYSLPSDGMR